MIFADQKRHWDALAHIDPYWAVLSDPDKIDGGWEKEEFYRSGRHEMVNVLNTIWNLGFKRRDHGRALDLGCGPGRNTHAMAKWFNEVVGYDISPQMLELAREDAKGNEEFVLNETDDLAPFADDWFDLIYSNITLQHIDPGSVPRYLGECARVLRPGGAFYFQFISHPNGLPGTKESAPQPAWFHEGLQPYYEVHPVRVDEMVGMILAFPLAVVQVRHTKTEGQSFFSYDYVVEKWPS